MKRITISRAPIPIQTPVATCKVPGNHRILEVEVLDRSNAADEFEHKFGWLFYSGTKPVNTRGDLALVMAARRISMLLKCTRIAAR